MATCIVSCTQQKTSATRQAWIASKSDYLRNLKPTNALSVAQSITVTNDSGTLQVYEISDEGLVPIDSTQWVYFVVHSGHRESVIDLPESERIGDISLAIDYRGYLYSNNTHVCPGIGALVRRTECCEVGFEPGRLITNTFSTTVEDVLSQTRGSGPDDKWHKMAKEAQHVSGGAAAPQK